MIENQDNPYDASYNHSKSKTVLGIKLNSTFHYRSEAGEEGAAHLHLGEGEEAAEEELHQVEAEFHSFQTAAAEAGLIQKKHQEEVHKPTRIPFRHQEGHPCQGGPATGRRWIRGQKAAEAVEGSKSSPELAREEQPSQQMDRSEEDAARAEGCCGSRWGRTERWEEDRRDRVARGRGLQSGHAARA